MTYTLGQPVSLEVSLKSENGQPADATSASLTVTTPNGTVETIAPDHPGLGTYRHTYSPATAGLYEVAWSFTGTNAAAPPVDVFDVRPATAGSCVSLADLRSHLNWTGGTGDDAELLTISAAATETCRGYLFRPILRQSFTQAAPAGSDVIVLNSVPCPCGACRPGRLLRVDEVLVGGQALAASAWTLDDAAGVVTLDGPAGDDVEVDYTAGYTVIPEWASMAVKRLTAHLWTRSQSARHSRGEGAPAESQPVATYLLPYAVQSLLKPHRAGSF